MTVDLKKIELVDIFVLMVTGDRLANEALITNINMLELLCGGKKVWKNIVVIITKKDFNPME